MDGSFRQSGSLQASSEELCCSITHACHCQPHKLAGGCRDNAIAGSAIRKRYQKTDPGKKQRIARPDD